MVYGTMAKQLCMYLGRFIRLALALDVKLLHHFEMAIVGGKVEGLPAKLQGYNRNEGTSPWK